ncbi:uncharacterized [Tachysurus ichikawai]
MTESQCQDAAVFREKTGCELGSDEGLHQMKHEVNTNPSTQHKASTHTVRLDLSTMRCRVGSLRGCSTA